VSAISEDDFRGLPEAPLAKFLALETIARVKLLELLHAEEDETLIAIAKQSYMSTVSVAAKMLKVEALVRAESRSSALGAGFDTFFKKVVETTTELQLSAHEFLNLYSVKVSKTTREKIRDQIVIIRDFVSEHNFSDAHKKRLQTLLDALETELDRPRASLSRLMLILGLIGTVSAGTVGMIADIPTAIGTITALIGQQKDEEPKRIEDLSQEVKLLPPPIESTKNEGP
jgi:hypothetical protein